MTRLRRNAAMIAALLAAALIATLLLSAGPSADVALAAKCKHTDGRPGEITKGQARRAAQCLINKRRKARDRRTLDREGDLKRTATSHARRMRNQRCIVHVCPGEPSLLSRIRATGYLRGADRWGIGEALNWGEGAQGTPRSIVNRWMDSSIHRGVLLYRKWRDIGVGVVWGTPQSPNGNGATWVADFGYSR